MAFERSEGIGGFISPISPAFAAVYMAGLGQRWRLVYQGICRDKPTQIALAGMALTGAISAMGAIDQRAAWATMLAPLLLIMMYALGRWAIAHPETFLRALTLGCATLALTALIARVCHCNIWLGDIPILANFHYIKLRGNILGMGDNGLAALIEAGVMGGVGFAFVSKGRQRLLYAAAGLVSFLGVLNTYSKGSLMAVLGALLILGVLNAGKLRKYWPHVLVGVLALVVLIFTWPVLSSRLHRIIDMSRVEIWQEAWRVIGQNWLLGTGPGNYGRFTHLAMSPHNMYLFILSGWGVGGFIIFMSWLVWATVGPLRHSPSVTQKIAFAMMVSFWLHVLVNDLFIPHVLLVMGCLGNEGLTMSTKDVVEVEQCSL